MGEKTNIDVTSPFLLFTISSCFLTTLFTFSLFTSLVPTLCSAQGFYIKS